MRGSYHPVGVRVQAVALMAQDFDIQRVEAITGMSSWTIKRWVKKAKERGFNPEIDQRILTEYVEDEPRSGRPKEVTQSIEESIISSVKKDHIGREKSSEFLAFESNISSHSVLKILKKHGFHSVKPTKKPGLTNEIRKRRLDFCLAHKDWTLEDWKNVIFTDETSVALNHRRGGIRIWHTKDEVNDPTCIQRRWKGNSDFMVWAGFSYDKKGPIHIWSPETAQQKQQATKEIEKLNRELEPIYKQEWELNTSMSRMRLRGNMPGREPVWHWNKRNGRLERDSKGGIDWWRYNKVSLKPFYDSILY